MPTGPSGAARTPFVLLVVVLLGGGMIGLLVLNSSVNEGSFQLSELKRQTTDLTDEEQALQREVNGYAEPGALERRARRLGMVPGGDPVFLDPDGTVRGVTASPGAPSPGAPGALPPSGTGAAPDDPLAPAAGTAADPATQVGDGGSPAAGAGPATGATPATGVAPPAPAGSVPSVATTLSR
nr:hypothetical protein [Streptomyces sulfonofaciens]